MALVRQVVFVLLLLFAFTVPWENLVDLGAVGRISKGVGLLLGAAWLYSLVLTQRVRRPAAGHQFAAAFVLWSTASVLWTVSLQPSLVRALTCVQLLVVLLVLWDVVEDLRQVRLLLGAYVLGAWVPTVGMLHAFLTGQADLVHGRVTIGGFHPNDVGVVLALALPLAWYLGADGSRLLTRLVWLTFVPAALFAVLLTGSRTGLFVALVAMAWALWDLGRRQPLVAAGVVVTTVPVASWLVGFVPERAASRLATTQRELTQGSLTGRAPVWTEALELIQMRPVHGSGTGSFRDAAQESAKVGHNFVLGLLVEVGVVGLVLFLGLLMCCFLAGRRAPGRLNGMWTTVFTMWIIAAAFHNWEYRKQSWFLLGLALVCGSEFLRNDEREADRRTSSGSSGSSGNSGRTSPGSTTASSPVTPRVPAQALPRR